jgi:hypothetical protein
MVRDTFHGRHGSSMKVRLLARTFFARMFESEMFSSPVSATYAVVWLLAALATPGVMISASQYYFYAHARTFTPETQDRILFVSQVFHVDFAMAIAAVVTMLVWTSLAPDRRDAFILGPLPISAGEAARARLISIGGFFTMFAAAVSIPTAFAFTFVTVGDGQVAEVPARVAGHIVATTMGAAFVFFLLVSMQLLLAATFGPRAVALMTWPLQVGAVLAVVVAVSATGRLADALLSPAAQADVAVMWNPAAWFVGLYRYIAGDPRVIFTALAARAVVAAAVVVGVAIIAYPLAHQRCLAQAIAAEGRQASWRTGLLPRLWLRTMAPFLGTPVKRGLAAFLVAVITRSHPHRVVVGSYLGLAVLFALPLAGRLLQPADTAAAQYAWISIPLGVICWATAGIRVAMMLPIETAANWIFKLTEPADKVRVLSAPVTITQGIVPFPVAAVFGLAAAVAGDLALGVTLFLVVFCAGSALVELLMLTLHIVPGTCTYRPGQLRLRLLWPLYLATWISVAYLLPTIVVSALGDPVQVTVVVGGLILTWAVLRRWRIARASRVTSLTYEESEPEATITVRLGGAGA